MIQVKEAIEVPFVVARDSKLYRNNRVFTIEDKPGFYRIDAGPHQNLQPTADDVAIVDGTMRRMKPFELLNEMATKVLADEPEDETAQEAASEEPATKS